MKNLFSLTTEKFESDYQSYIKKPKDADALLDEIIFSIPFNYSAAIPTNTDKEPIKLSSLADIKKFFQNQAKKKSIQELADLCIDLCEPYLYAAYPIAPPETFMLQQLFSQENISATDTAMTVAADFSRSIFQNNFEFRQSLKDFLILSYYHTMSKKSSVSLPAIMKAITPGYKEDKKSQYTDPQTTKNIENVNKEVDKIYSRLSTVKNHFQPKISTPYLYTLLEYRATKGNSEKLNLRWNSWYDAFIMFGLINTNQGENPFLSFPISTIDLGAFLNNFDPRIKSSSLKNINSVFRNMVNYIHTSNTDMQYLTKETLSAFYQFFLERVTNINLINKCYKICTTAKLPDGYYLLASYPLVKFRLTLLDAYVKKCFELPKNMQYAMPLALDDIIKHHIFCFFPLVNILFHMLMLSKKENIGDTNTYFNALNKRLTLFTGSSQNALAPEYPFMDKAEVTSRPIIYQSIYENFLLNMNKTAEIDFLESFKKISLSSKYRYDFVIDFKKSYESAYEPFGEGPSNVCRD